MRDLRPPTHPSRPAATRSPVRTFSVSWVADFESDSPEEAIHMAYEQIRSYGDRGTQAPELVADDGYEKVTVDLGQAEG